MHSSCDLGLRIFTPFGGIGVAIFLILSGFGLNESYKRKGCKKYWKNKITKIWIPYLIVFLIISAFNRQDINWSKWCLELVCIDCKFWYVSFLFYNYVLLFLCFKSKILYKYRYLIFALFAVCLFLFDNRIRGEQCLSFISGMLLSYYKDKISNFLSENRLLSLIEGGLLFLSITVLALKQVGTARAYIETFPIIQNATELLIKLPFSIFVIIAVCFSIGNKNNKIGKIVIGNRFLLFCSTISLELYIVHFSLRPLITKDSQMTSIIIFLISSFVFSWLLYMIKNKINCVLWKK